MKHRNAWPSVAVKQRIRELNELLALVRRTSRTEEYAPHLDRYLVVRSAGLVESVRDDVAKEHALAVSPSRTHRRISKSLKKGEGAHPEQLFQFLHTFDQEWANNFEEWLTSDDGQHKNNMAALVSARKKIAHGDGDSINSAQVLCWAETALEIAKWLVNTFDPR